MPVRVIHFPNPVHSISFFVFTGRGFDKKNNIKQASKDSSVVTNWRSSNVKRGGCLVCQEKGILTIEFWVSWIIDQNKNLVTRTPSDFYILSSLKRFSSHGSVSETEKSIYNFITFSTRSCVIQANERQSKFLRTCIFF